MNILITSYIKDITFDKINHYYGLTSYKISLNRIIANQEITGRKMQYSQVIIALCITN